MREKLWWEEVIRKWQRARWRERESWHTILLHLVPYYAVLHTAKGYLLSWLCGWPHTSILEVTFFWYCWKFVWHRIPMQNSYSKNVKAFIDRPEARLSKMGHTHYLLDIRTHVHTTTFAESSGSRETHSICIIRKLCFRDKRKICVAECNDSAFFGYYYCC